ncbi:hypothetical protein [Sphaerisporangium corydalis]|uniref:XRE family transcriptional regulator n=1 Tax=Sphaerisporangium corydalis TaxID=1441875 RepID=A0ABV9EEY3_9ACTN|nr:hypothetical protein [Sphaerisporangium corydalis]
MSGEGYRVLLDCRRRSATLRAKGFSHDQVADIFAAFYDVSPLRLHRLSYGRTAAEVVATFNDLDPAGTACLREGRLYDYETWPSRGKRPSARALTILAQIYRTTARRLVADQVYASYTVRDRDLIDHTDHRHLDTHRPRHIPASKAGHVTMERPGVRTDGHAPSPAPADCAALLRALAAEEADVKRRDLLFELALALGGIPALALLRHLSPTEKDRLAIAVRTSGHVDFQTVAVVEKLTARCRRLDDEFGPETVLPIVESQRDLVAGFLRRESLSPGLRDRLIRTYADLSQLSGWLHFDLLDYPGAKHRYQDALTAAHQITDAALIGYLHDCLSHMYLRQGSTGLALDHIFAAREWVRKSGSGLLASVHATDLARVLARTGERRASEFALDQSATAIQRPRNENDPAYLYWWTANGVRKNTAYCMLALGRPEETIRAVEAALAAPQARKLARGETFVYYADALIRKREIPAAADTLREAARLTTQHSSNRLADSVRQARARLQPWADNKHVRTLDDELHTLAITSTATR